MLRRLITDNERVIGIFSLFIFFVIRCSYKGDSAEDKAEKSAKTTIVDFGNELHREHLLDGVSKIARRLTSTITQFFIKENIDYKYTAM